MRRVNTYAFFTLGKSLAPLQNLEETSKIVQVMIVLFQARSEVSTLLNNDIVAVRMCRHAADELITAISAVVPLDFNEAMRVEKDKTLDWYEAYKIKQAATKFETVLAEELNIIDTYAVAQKGAYSTAELIANAEIIFPDNVRNKLPPQTIYDIREAGKCLAFETPTASAFHIVRAVESVMLAYFTKITGKHAPPRMRNWGVYIKLLRDSGRSDPKVVNFLEHIKDNYRNPVTHPEAVLTVDDVQVLLGAACSAISQMSAPL